MTAADLISYLNLKTVNLANGESEVTGVYVGDLLSRVMSNAGRKNAWITVITSPAVLAVASISGLSCVIIAEDSDFDDNFVKTANDKKINVFSSSLSAYELCSKIHAMSN